METPFAPPDEAARDSLLQALRGAVGGAFVATSDADTFPYRRDLWPRLTVTARDGLPEVPPLAVVRPADEAEVEAVVRALHEHGCPIVAYGAGSGVCGGAAPLFGGVVVDLKRLDDLAAVDEGTMQVDVGPGLILQTLEERLNDQGWTLGHFPSSIYCCSIGGCVAARGAGQLSSRYGKIEDMVTGLRIVTPGLGTLDVGSLDPTAPDIDWSPLFIGSEGTFGLITKIRLRLHPLPKTMVLRGIQFPSVEAGISAFREILQMGLRPSVMRLYDPLDTWMAMQKGNDPGDGPAPRPGGGAPLDTTPEPPRENAVDPLFEAPPEDAGTARLFGKVLSPGSFADEALSRMERVPGFGRFARDRRKGGDRRDHPHRGGRRASDAPSGFKGMLVRTLAARLLGDEAATSLKPENLPMDRLLAYARPLNRAIDLLPGRSLAILGFEGDDEVALGQLEAAVLAAGRLGGKDLGPGPGERWFRTRYHVSFKLPKLLQSGAWADTMETAAPWTKVSGLYEAVRSAAAPHALVMAHFSHAYHEGCSIYFTLAGYAATPEERMHQYDLVWRKILTAAEGIGATITHHHGVGFLKRQLMDKEHGDGRALFEASKRALDPGAVLNPGKLFPPDAPPPGPVEPAPEPRHLVVHAHEDGVIEAGTDWRGVDLASELALRGHFLPPLGRHFLEGTVGDWLSSGAYAAHVAIHGAWEHPLQATSGRLPDGRRWRSGRLPRSAAGPSWLPFGLGADEGAADIVTLRTLTPPPMRHLGFVFPHMDEALAACRTALRGSIRPLGGAIYRGTDPAGYRDAFSRDLQPRDGGVLYLALGWPDGFPHGVDLVLARLRASGATVLPDEDGLAWWEDHWGQPQREGDPVMEITGPRPDEALVGRCSAVVPWGKAQTLLRAVETLTGGPTDAVGVVESPVETGCTVRWRFFSSRPGQPTSHLVLHQLRETIRSFGARIEELDFPHVEPLPPGAFGGRDETPSDAARLRDALWGEVTQ